jgi:hypothetical protein
MKLKLRFLVFFSLLSVVSAVGQLRAQEAIPTVSSQSDIVPSTGFKRHQFTVSRQNGKIYFDGNVVPSHFRESKNKEVRLIEIFDDLSFPSDGELVAWARKLRGTRTYTYDEVTQVDSSGTSTTMPLVFFKKDQRAELDISWNAWLDKRQADLEAANRLRMAEEKEARIYQQQAQLQQLQTQAILAQTAAAKQSANSLAVISGETSLWEIELVPAGQYSSCIGCSTSYSRYPYTYGYETSGVSFNAFGNGNFAASFGSNNWYGNGSGRFYVKGYGRSSDVAGYAAAQNNPGYRVGTIRKLAGY